MNKKKIFKSYKKENTNYKKQIYINTPNQLCQNTRKYTTNPTSNNQKTDKKPN